MSVLPRVVIAISVEGRDVIHAYEDAFAKAVGARYAYAFWKGRVALYAILRALGIGSGDEVVLPGFTCVVVANCVSFAGATPVFADIEPDTYNLNPASVRRAITPRTKALIIQHTFGVPAAMEPLLEIAGQYGLTIIEDCAHALGSTYRGRSVGTFGAAAFYSSQWSKPYTTGLGGVAVTGDPELSMRLRGVHDEFSDPPLAKVTQLRAQYSVYNRFFSPRLYWFALNTLRSMSEWHLFVGSSGKEELNSEMPADASWRMSSFQAQVGLAQLSTLPQNLAHRRRLAEFYKNLLEARGWRHSGSQDYVESVYVRYPVRVANKWKLLRKAQRARVELGGWFESVLHPIRVSLEKFGYHPGSCPVAERAANEIINLPLHLGVSIDEAERIVDFISQHGRRIAHSALQNPDALMCEEIVSNRCYGSH